MWYPPLSPGLFAVLSKITTLDIPTVVTRIIPFLEAFSPVSIYFLARYLYHEKIAVYATIILCLTPSFIYWTGIGDPQFFTLFLIPVYILYLLKYSRGEYGNKSLILMGVLLGVVFLFHLSYFALLLSLIMVLIYLSSKKVYKRPLFCFFVLLLVSQVVAVWWWYPRDLYWWWIHGLTSSTGHYTPLKHFFKFGMVTAVLGGIGFFFPGLKTRQVFCAALFVDAAISFGDPK
jgi:4-amino-4-deoxy-L-arabinose transferase-like glycosyltransferase